ncbi:MAG: hypothetical protein ACYS32_00620 [Planctomycetota bacterium]|jgi:hypothetical protein
MGGKIDIVPYTHIDGCPTFKDSELLELYDRIVEQGIEPVLFHDDSINTADQFLRSAKSTQTLLFVCYVDGKKPLGIIWLNRFEKTSAQGHFVYFNEWWGTENTTRCSRKFMEMATRTLFPTLIGIVPSSNKAAVKHANDCGFHMLGDIPNFLYSKEKQSPVTATIFYTTKDDFKNENLQ